MACILLESYPAPVPWMTSSRTMRRTSLRHEAVLFRSGELSARLASRNRVAHAMWDPIAKRAAAERLSRRPVTTQAYTGPTAGLQPESSFRGFHIHGHHHDF